MTRIFRRDEELLDDAPPASSRAAFEPVDNEQVLDAVFSTVSPHATLLFLHDPFCPISAIAFEEVEQLETRVSLLDVSRHSALGRLVQERTGIRHESPQAIVLLDGKPVWHASHGRIRADALREALADHPSRR